MSEAAKPADMRRGLVGGRHPLEPPEGADASDADGVSLPTGQGGPGKKNRVQLPGKDRWGLDPVAKGWYRGNVENIKRMTEVTVIGELVTYHFDLRGAEGQPKLPIEFVGYTFSKEIRPNLVVETFIGPTFPTERIRRERLRLSFDPTNDLRAETPVKTALSKRAKQRRNGIIVLVFPIIFVSAVLWVLSHVLHVF